MDKHGVSAFDIALSRAKDGNTQLFQILLDHEQDPTKKSEMESKLSSIAYQFN